MRARNNALAIIILLAPRASALFAATVDAASLSFLPLRHSPGEEVEVQAILRPEGGERLVELDLRRGSGLDDQGDEADPELRELRVAKNAAGWMLSWRFVPWSPGVGSLPAIRVKGISIPSIPYSAISALGPDDRDPSPPRRQRDPPGTELYLYGLAGLLLALALAVAGTSAYLVPAARALLARRRAAEAFRRFEKSLDYLAAEAGSAEPGPFFAALSRVLRLYLAARAFPEAPALTSAELGALPDDAFPAPATKARVAALIALADEMRFGRTFGAGADAGAVAGDRPGSEARSVLAKAAADARAIGEANEEALVARL